MSSHSLVPTTPPQWRRLAAAMGNGPGPLSGLACLQQELDAGMPLNTCSYAQNKPETLLDLAVRHRCEDAALYLLDRGATFSQAPRQLLRNALWSTIVTRRVLETGVASVADLLADMPNPRSNERYYDTQLLGLQLPTLAVLLDHGLEVDARIDCIGDDGKRRTYITQLVDAGRRYDIERALFCLQRGAQPDLRSYPPEPGVEHSLTLFQAAVTEGRNSLAKQPDRPDHAAQFEGFMRAMLAHGLPLNLGGPGGTALLEASGRAYINKVRVLLDLGGDQNYRTPADRDLVLRFAKGCTNKTLHNFLLSRNARAAMEAMLAR